MTKKEMEELSDMIIAKLIDKQKDLDEIFLEQLEATNVPVEINKKLNPKDELLVNIGLSYIKLDELVELEKYNEASLYRTKINMLKEKIKDF